MTRDALINNAIKSYHSFLPSRTATSQNDQAFLRRIVVNHLKHHSLGYNRRKSDAAHAELKRQVLGVIASELPWLAQECHRQLQYNIAA